MNWRGLISRLLTSIFAHRSDLHYQTDQSVKRGRSSSFFKSDFELMVPSKSDCILDFSFPIGTEKKISSSVHPLPVANLHEMSCTCEYFQDIGREMPRGTPQRYCRHLLTFLAEKIGDKHPYLIGMSLDGYAREHSHIYEIKVNGFTICWAGSPTYSSPFLSVYARTRKKSDKFPPGSGGVECYRLSCSGDRWAYARAPFGARKIKIALLGLGIWKGAKFK